MKKSELVCLENDFLSLLVNPLGAELCSLQHKTEKREYLWHADNHYWGKHSPILFPIVGSLKGGKYHYKGEDYHLNRHGFARERTFQIHEQGSNFVRFRLESDETTETCYPFHFQLILSYELEENRLRVGYQVTNTETSGSQELLFSIGGHPAFNCPLDPQLKFEDYYLEFNEEEEWSSLQLNEEGLFLPDTYKKVQNKSNRLNLNYSLFDGDALVFDRLKSNVLTLKSDKSPPSLRFDFTNFPYMALWTPPQKEAPFLCLEPWFGHADYSDTDGDFCRKKGVISLSSEEVWAAQYTVSLL